MHFDYHYLCQGLGHLTGLQTRVFFNGELSDQYSQYRFDPDVAGPILAQAFASEQSVSYIETEDLLLYGVIHSQTGDDATIVIGPTSQIQPGEQEAIAVLHQLGEPYSRLPELKEYFANMIPYPLENFLGILCFLNYAINEEKYTSADLIVGNREQPTAPDDLSTPPVENEEGLSDTMLHNTLQMERQMLSYVTAGNIEAIERFLRTPATGRIGSLAHNALRQQKNTFIVSATLISRAAIDGGLPAQTAFALSDRFIQKAELLNTGNELALLSMELLLDYTNRVNALKYGAGESPFAVEVLRYVMQNLNRKLTTADIAEALQVNRQHLCERFHTETGMTVGECITNAKLDEAKRMLDTTALHIAEISEYLAFSSQSYFQNVFKKANGCTPKEYRATKKTASGKA